MILGMFFVRLCHADAAVSNHCAKEADLFFGKGPFAVHVYRKQTAADTTSQYRVALVPAAGSRTTHKFVFQAAWVASSMSESRGIPT